MTVIGTFAKRTSPVMVKVLTRGTQNLGAVRRHLEYLDRKGELEIQTDDGQKLTGKGVERELLENWDLDGGRWTRLVSGPDLGQHQHSDLTCLLSRLILAHGVDDKSWRCSWLYGFGL